MWCLKELRTGLPYSSYSINTTDLPPSMLYEVVKCGCLIICPVNETLMNYQNYKVNKCIIELRFKKNEEKEVCPGLTCRIPVACTDRNQVSIYCSHRTSAANQTLSTNHSTQSTDAPRNLLSLLRFSLSFGFTHCFHLCSLDPNTATSQGSSEKQVQDKPFPYGYKF